MPAGRSDGQYSLWDWVKRRERSKEITEQKNLTKTKFVYDYLDGNKSHHYLVLVSSSQDILGTKFSNSQKTGAIHWHDSELNPFIETPPSSFRKYFLGPPIRQIG